MVQLNRSIFYLQNKVDKEKSLQLAKEVISNMLSFLHIPSVQEYLNTSYKILEHWGIDVEDFLKNRKK